MQTSLRCQEICHRDINYLDLANIDLELMSEDIKPGIMNGDTLDTQVGKLENTLKGALDKHAPLQTKSVMNRQRVPWFTEEVREMKKKNEAQRETMEKTQQ